MGTNLTRRVFFVSVLFASLISLRPAAAQDEKMARQLRRFETDWLAATLNNDRAWLKRFTDGRLFVKPSGKEALERSELTAALFPALPANQFKFRITGTISVVTSDPVLNRSFTFLDTFNKIDGKWQVIASNFAAGEGQTALGSAQNVEKELRRLETLFDHTRDRTVLESIIAPDFVGTLPSGRVQNRAEWLMVRGRDVEARNNAEMSVRVYSDNNAVVTGILRKISAKNGNRGATEFRFTNTWLRRGRAWQCIAAHLSPVS